MTRGKLAKLCKVNIETLRYYERRGLLNPPTRSESGYRLYSEQDVIRIRFIKNAQKLGFTLKEITELLKLRVKNTGQCNSVLKKAQEKYADVEKKIDDLKSMRKVLKQLIDKCENASPTTDCPILESMEMGKEI